MKQTINPNDIGLCNCAQCNRDLLGEKTFAKFAEGRIQTRQVLPPPVHGRINGRPYCATCHPGVAYAVEAVRKANSEERHAQD